MTIATPDLIRAGNQRYRETLAAASTSEGTVAVAARRLQRVLLPHLEREEEFAFPALALLPLVGLGKFQPDMDEALPLTERLRKELPRLLAQHREIVQLAETLRRAAVRGGQDELVRLTEQLLAQTELEEEILYPAALLVGDRLRGSLSPR